MKEQEIFNLHRKHWNTSNVVPMLSIDDARYRVTFHANESSNSSDGENALSMNFPDFYNLLISKFTNPASLSTLHSSVSDCIRCVALMSAPTKIIDIVINSVTVSMAAYCTFWTMTHERQQNQMMNQNMLSIRKGDFKITFNVLPSSKYPSSDCSIPTTEQGFDSSSIGNAVSSVVTRNISPAFDTIVMNLNAFVQTRTAVTVGHNRYFPSIAPCKEKWAGGREYRFSIRRSSPSYLIDSNNKEKGEFQWN